MWEEKIHSRASLCRERSGIATAGKNPKQTVPQTLGMRNVAGWSKTEQSPEEESAGQETRHSSPLSQLSPPVPNLGMALAFWETASKLFLLQKHKHSSSWHRAAKLIQEAARSTCSPTVVPWDGVGTVPPCQDVS